MTGALWIAVGMMSVAGIGAAQTATDDFTDPIGAGAKPQRPEFIPLTASERARKYIVGAFGPGALVRAAAGGAIAQSSPAPKEWGGGAEAYADRVGNVLAQHVIREALEFGGSAVLKEDNRYFRSAKTGFFKRSTHAMASLFVARDDAGGEHFAYSRFGAVVGSSFISRIWQPRSRDSSGDAAVSFGITMVSDLGWNCFKEFCPRGLKRRFGAH